MPKRLIVRGPGMRGPQGVPGLPGVNAVPADSAVAGYVENEDSETRLALDEIFGGGGGGAGLPSTIVNRTTTYTAAAGEFVRGDTIAGGFTVTLPTAPAVGALVAVQKTDASGNALTAAPAGGGTINGDANATIVSRYAGAVLEHLGSNAWTVVSLFSTTGPKGDTGPQGPAGTGGINPVQDAGVVGRWYCASPLASTAIANRSVPLNTFVLGAPVIAQRNLTIDQLGCYVQTAGPEGALIRLGIYTPSNQADPYGLALGAPYATLLAGSDTGTAPSAGSATAQGRLSFTLASPITIPKGTAFAVGFGVQGAGPVGVYVENVSSVVGAMPWGTTDMLDGAAASVIRTDVPGALPGTFTPTAFLANGFGGGGHYRRSA